MSIGSLGGPGAMALSNVLSPFLSQLNRSQATSSTAISTSSAASAFPSCISSSASADSSNNLTGSGTGQISSDILALLVQMQQIVDGSQSAATGSAATGSASTGTTSSATTTTAPNSTTMVNTLAALNSAALDINNLEQAIQNAQSSPSQTSASTIISPIMGLLDSLDTIASSLSAV